MAYRTPAAGGRYAGSTRDEGRRPVEALDSKSSRLVVGVDVAAARPCTAVAVRGVQVERWMDTGDVEALVAWITEIDPQVVAVDAPQGPSRGLLIQPVEGAKPYAGRVCDRELRRRGMPLYEVPGDKGAAPAWMGVGFAIFAGLLQEGYMPAVAHENPARGPAGRAALEVYPHASFVSLRNGGMPKKTTRSGIEARVRLLHELGLSWDGRFDHDSLDALVAAATGLLFLEGRGIHVGDATEGLVWLPDRDAPSSSGGDTAGAREVDAAGTSFGPPACPFCAKIARREIVVENELAVAFRDSYPLTEDHTLVVSRRHAADYFSLSELEQAALWRLVAAVRADLESAVGARVPTDTDTGRRPRSSPDGYNLGVNVGGAAGQTVGHAHVHIVPRRIGDVADPRGGVRWVLPERAAYWDVSWKP